MWLLPMVEIQKFRGISTDTLAMCHFSYIKLFLRILQLSKYCAFSNVKRQKHCICKLVHNLDSSVDYSCYYLLFNVTRIFAIFIYI